jgi:uncharacterized protein YndB with AHSA1/START domain
MTTSIEFDTFLPQPPAGVWRALTDPELLSAWLMPNDFRPEVGHDFSFWTVPGEEFDGVVHCHVLRLEPERLLTISWIGGPGLDTTVTWRLRPEGTGTRLFLTHAGFDPADERQQSVRRLLGGGWRGHLAERLAQVVAGRA